MVGDMETLSMKNAEEVAKEVAIKHFGAELPFNAYQEELISIVAQALTAFAEERSEKEQVKGFDKGYRRARAEALEECRQLCKCGVLNDIH